MPLYEYRCTKCQTLIEVFQGFTDPPPKKCAKCGAAKLEKVISRSGFVLKGGGWYQTDYQSAASKKDASKDNAKDGGDSSASSPSKSDSDSGGSKPESTSGDSKAAGDSADSKPATEPSRKKKAKDSPGN